MDRKRNALLISLSSLSFFSLSLLSFSLNNLEARGTLGSECSHAVTNHYDAKEPTLSDAGLNNEYWVCCSCHKKWTDKNLTNVVEYSSLVLNKKTNSSTLSSLPAKDYLLDKLNSSDLENIQEHSLLENDGNVSFFAKNSTLSDTLTSFTFDDIPTSSYKLSFKYKYYDLSKDKDKTTYHSYISYGNNIEELHLVNDNLWHDYSFSFTNTNELTFNIYHFIGELFISDVSFENGYSLDNVFSSNENLSHYFSYSNGSCANSTARFDSISSLGIKKTLIDEALNKGYTHLKFDVSSNSSLVNDMHLEGNSYSKVYNGNSNTVRIDLRQIAKGDYSSVKLNFRSSSYANTPSDVTLSNLVFFSDSSSSSWTRSNPNLYACFENDTLVIDSCFAGNGAYVSTSKEWYSSFANNNVVDMYFVTSYISKQDNYRGVLWGKNGSPINNIELGEYALTNQAYSSSDTFLFMLEKEGVISINVYNKDDYTRLKARERLSNALKEKDSFSSYFLTGDISSDTLFSSTNNKVFYQSKILGLKKQLLVDMALSNYTNIAFDFASAPLDSKTSGNFNHVVYTSDGLDTSDSWKVIYNEFDTDKLTTSLHLDIDLSTAFSYQYSSEPVITIRARRNGTEGIDSNQSISSLYFYNKEDIDETFNISLTNGNQVDNHTYRLNESLTLPYLEDRTTGVFKGWLKDGVLHKPGETIYVNGSMDFIASFDENLFSLKNGNYSIVYEDNNQSAYWAASDLKKYIGKSLNASPKIYKSSEFSYSRSSNVISIGNTIALEEVGSLLINDSFIDIDTIKASLLKKDDSFVIASRNSSLFLVGNNGNSLRYASTKLLETKLNIKFFSSEEESIPSMDECIIKNGGTIYNPYFDFRTYLTVDAYSSNTDEKYDYNSHLYNDSDYSNSCSVNEYDNAWLEGYYKDKQNKDALISTSHNTYSSDDLGLVKLSTYPAEQYPDMWFKYNDNVIDIHYSDGITSEGKIDRSTSATDNAAEAMYDSLKAVLTSYYSKNAHDKELYFSIGQADTNECCKCDKCLENAYKYNNSGTMIRFYNAIINELKQDSTLKDCNFKLVMFAYQYNLFSPLIHQMDVKTNTTGIISKKTSKTINGYIYDESKDSVDETAIPDKDHLYVRVAPLVMDQYLGIEDGASYLLQRFNGRIYDENANKWMVDNVTYGDHLGHYKASILFKDWASVTSNLMTWYYDCAFSYGFATYLGSVSRIERFIDCIKEYGYMGSFIQANFKDNIYVDTLLNAYVYSRLCWDDNNKSATELRDEFVDSYFDSSSAPYIKEYYSMMDGYYEDAFKDSGLGYNMKNITSISEDNLYKAKKKLDEALSSTSDETIKGRIERLELTPMFMMAKLDEAWRVHFMTIFNKYGGKYVNESYTLSEYVW